MKVRLSGLALVLGLQLGGSARSDAQVSTSTASPSSPARSSRPINGPLYGTSWGEAGYGTKRLFSEFSSSYGPGYAYGYPPAGFVPGRFGSELWRPGSSAASVGSYGVSHRYRTFPYPYPPGPPAYGPSIGVFAPGFGPGAENAWRDGW